MNNRVIMFLLVAFLLNNNAVAEDITNMTTIVHLDISQLDNIELARIEDYPFMKVVDGDDPKAGGLTSFTSSDGKLDIGLSRYLKVTLQLVDWPVDEFMYFLEGQVEITDESGTSRIYGPGDAIVMPKGFNGTWRQLSPIKKINISYPIDNTSIE